jgi:hypothetical protein
MDGGYRVNLVNTAAIPQYARLKHGNDHTDALHMAQLMRLGLLPEGYIYPREQRATRDPRSSSKELSGNNVVR